MYCYISLIFTQFPLILMYYIHFRLSLPSHFISDSVVLSIIKWYSIINWYFIFTLLCDVIGAYCLCLGSARLFSCLLDVRCYVQAGADWLQ